MGFESLLQIMLRTPYRRTLIMYFYYRSTDAATREGMGHPIISLNGDDLRGVRIRLGPSVSYFLIDGAAEVCYRVYIIQKIQKQPCISAPVVRRQ